MKRPARKLWRAGPTPERQFDHAERVRSIHSVVAGVWRYIFVIFGIFTFISMALMEC
jgi:hypothetical protein